MNNETNDLLRLILKELISINANLKGNELLSDVDKSTLLELLSKIGIELL